MVTVFSTLQKLDVDEADFKYLKTDTRGRYIYVSTDYLLSYLAVRGQSSALHIFEQEIKNSNLALSDVLELWLGVTEKNILNLDVAETETFIELYSMKSSKDLFMNLMEVKTDENKSIGEVIFLSFLAEIIRKGRD